MGITVAQLSTDSLLGLRVLSGHEGLHRVIRWAHTSELADPTPWLEGGELLMTLGLNLPRDDTGQGEYVRRLAEAGVAGLAFDTGMVHPEVPAEVVRAGDRTGLAVLAVPAATPFLAISRVVIAAVTADQLRAVRQISKDQERLASAALVRGTGGVVQILSRALSASIVLLDGEARALESAGPDRADVQRRVVDRLAAYAARRTPGSTTRRQRGGFTHVDDGGHLTVVSLAAPTPSRGYLALGSSRAFTASERLLVSHAVTLLSILLDRPTHLREAESRLRKSVFRALLRQGPETDLALVQFFGFRPTGPVAVVVLVDVGPARAAEALVAARLDELGSAFLVTTIQDGLAALLPAERVVDLAADLQTHLRQALSRDISAGVGKSVDLPDAIESLRQARAAGRLAMTEPGRRVLFSDLGVFELLLGTQPRDTLEAIASAVLHPLEAGGGADLVRTTAEFLVRNGHWEATAAALGVHRHTLRHRIDRVSELLGRDMGAAHSRAEVWMALKAQELLSMSRSDGSSWLDPPADGE